MPGGGCVGIFPDMVEETQNLHCAPSVCFQRQGSAEAMRVQETPLQALMVQSLKEGPADEVPELICPDPVHLDY